MFWECKHTFANEVWPEGWTDTAVNVDLTWFRQSAGAWQVTLADLQENEVSLRNLEPGCRCGLTFFREVRMNLGTILSQITRNAKLRLLQIESLLWLV
jgi:hypothetical protein